MKTKPNMIYTWLIVSTCLLVSACDRSSDPLPTQQPLLLETITTNEMPRAKLAYDDQKRIVRFDSYFQGSPSTYTLFEYGETGLKESKRYDAETHQLQFRRVFTLDQTGKPIKSDNYFQQDLTQVGSQSIFGYTPTGDMILHQHVIGSSPYSQSMYQYDAQRRMTQIKVVNNPGSQNEYTSLEMNWNYDANVLPNLWPDLQPFFTLTGLYEIINHMFSEDAHVKLYDSNNGTQTSHRDFSYSEREYNTEGYMTHQVVTRSTNLLNPGSPEQVVEYTFTYTK